MSRKITILRSDGSTGRLNDLANKIAELFRKTNNLPEDYKIEEIQIDILHGETRIIINNE